MFKPRWYINFARNNLWNKTWYNYWVGVAWAGTLLLYTLSNFVGIKKIIGIDVFMPNDLKKDFSKSKSKKIKLIVQFNNKLLKNKEPMW